MTTVIFINPEDTYLNKTGGKKGDRPPLGLAMLSAYCKQHNLSTKIFDLNHDSEQELKLFVKEKKPEFICFTIATPNYFGALNLAKKLKRKDNILICGGNHITNNPTEKRTLKVFDYAVIGDGEEAILKIIKEGSKEQIIDGGKTLDLNTLPLPDFVGLKFKRYFMTVEGKKGAIVITSRGCLYNCCYCTSANIKKWRSRNPEHVMEELRLLYHKYNVRGFFIADDIAFFPQKSSQERFIKLCNMIKEEMPDVVMRVTTRADALTEEICKVMSEAGVKWISLGIESLSDIVLQKMNKNMTSEQQIKGIELCQKYGIGTKCFFISGLPGETKETQQETLAKAKELKQKYGDKLISDCYILVPSPGTLLWNNPEKYGIEVFRINNWEKYNQILESDKPLFRHPNLSHNEIKDYVNTFKREIGENKSTN